MSGTPERILTARGAWLAARDAWFAGVRDWLAAMAADEAHRLEVNRLWLEYLELADPVRAPKIRRLLKHDKKDVGVGMPADELFPEASVSLGRSIPRRKSCGLRLRVIIRDRLRLRYATPLIKSPI